MSTRGQYQLSYVIYILYLSLVDVHLQRIFKDCINQMSESLLNNHNKDHSCLRGLIKSSTDHVVGGSHLHMSKCPWAQSSELLPILRIAPRVAAHCHQCVGVSVCDWVNEQQKSRKAPLKRQIM